MFGYRFDKYFLKFFQIIFGKARPGNCWAHAKSSWAYDGEMAEW